MSDRRETPISVLAVIHGTPPHNVLVVVCLVTMAILPSCQQTSLRGLVETRPDSVSQAPDENDPLSVVTDIPAGEQNRTGSSASMTDTSSCTAEVDSSHLSAATTREQRARPVAHEVPLPIFYEPSLLTTLEPDEQSQEHSNANLLTLADLELQALEDNPTIGQALAGVQRSRGIQTQVGLRPNPTFGFQATEIGNEGNAGQQGLFVAQEFVIADKLELNRTVAAEEVRMKSWQWQAQQQRVRNTVRLYYYELLRARRTLKLTRELKRIADQAVEASQRLLEAGEGNKSQLLQAQIESRRRSVAAQNAENSVRAAGRRLAAVVGDVSLQPADIADSFDDELPEFGWDETRQHLLENSPELQVAYAAVNRARWAIQRARVEPIPNVKTQVSLQYDDSTNYTIASVQTGIQWPVFNRNQGNIRAARAELIRATHEVQRVKLSLYERLARAFRDYQNARQQVEEFRSRILSLAGENLKLATEGYRQGQQSYLKLLTVQRTYFEANLGYVNTLTTLWQSATTIQGLLLTNSLSSPNTTSPPSPAG